MNYLRSADYQGHSPGPAQNTQEGRVLGYGTAARGFVIIASLIPIGLGSVLVASSFREPSLDSAIFGLCLGGVLLFSILWFIADMFFVRFIWNDQEIRSEAPWRGPRSIRWGDLQHVSYRIDRGIMHSGGGRLLLRSTGGDKITITFTRIGFTGGRTGFVDFAHDVLRLAPPGAVASFRQSPILTDFGITP